jgi:hypothetical protein
VGRGVELGVEGGASLDRAVPPNRSADERNTATTAVEAFMSSVLSF